MLQRLAAIAVATLLCVGTALAQDKLPPLKTGVDGTYAPHAMPKLGGRHRGLPDRPVQRGRQADASRDRDRQRELLGAGPRPAIRPLRLLAAPVTVTKERAENMLFTSGYLWTFFQFGIKKGSTPLKGWEDLKGKAVAVNKGTPYETVSKAMGEKYGFTVCKPTTPSRTPCKPCCRGVPTPPSPAIP